MGGVFSSSRKLGPVNGYYEERELFKSAKILCEDQEVVSTFNGKKVFVKVGSMGRLNSLMYLSSMAFSTEGPCNAAFEFSQDSFGGERNAFKGSVRFSLVQKDLTVRLRFYLKAIGGMKTSSEKVEQIFTVSRISHFPNNKEYVFTLHPKFGINYLKIHGQPLHYLSFQVAEE